MEGPSPRALRVRDFAEALRIPQRTAYDLIRRGEVAHLRLGRIIVIPTSEVERLIGSATCEVRPVVPRAPRKAVP